jgi:Spy/CpxP family protein refolding chaperone
MTMKKILGCALALVLVGALGVALTAQAQQPPQGAAGGPGWHGRGPGGGMGPMGMLGRGLRALNLTPDQQAQVKTIFQNHQADIQAQMKAGLAARKAFHDAAIGGDPNVITATGQTLAATIANGEKLRTAIHDEVFAILTPEQQQKANDMKANAQQRMKGMGRRGKGGPGGF